MWNRTMSTGGVFIYKCVASNTAGTGQSESVTVTVAESFNLIRRPADPTVVVEGVNSTQVHLVWNFTDCSSFAIIIDRERPDGSQNTRIASRSGPTFNIFNSDYEANLPATLVIKNVTRNDEYVYVFAVFNTYNFKRELEDSVAVEVLCKY
ncbi:uncharacterized protein LOC110053033 [Orbicella faveolata]|uniref:uncharacterized protein LOC110053033 n=1 Tax=Orbicella faveolata TaxID=48498 RepID=UPI0009E52D21|nr:uncharacterized protein LOC110053033 [Orbicella faveolata]